MKSQERDALRIAELEEALKPFVDFAIKRDAKYRKRNENIRR